MSARGVDVDSLLEDWPDWPLTLTGPPRVVAEVPGGRTNRSLRLDAPGLDHDLLLRIHPDPVSLGIDREREREFVTATARAGLGRPFLHWDPDDRFVVFPWLEARTWTDADLTLPIKRARLWPLLERLGEIELRQPRRRYCAYLNHYWRQLGRAGLIDSDLNSQWRQFQPRLAAFDRAPWTRAPGPPRSGSGQHSRGQRSPVPDRLGIRRPRPPRHRHLDDQPRCVAEPFIGEMMGWINDLWERLV